MVNLLDGRGFTGTCSPESKGPQQSMKIGKSGDISCWRTEPHRRANNGIKHPRGEDDRRAGFSLNDDDLSFRSPFGVEPAHLTAVKRMPAVMDLNVLADMGRMDPRWRSHAVLVRPRYRSDRSVRLRGSD
jgi:hypothetical protein